VVRQHLQTVRAVLLRQLVARALIVLETIVGPCTGYPIAPGLTAAPLDYCMIADRAVRVVTLPSKLFRV
jgi:hypothetical protein